MRNIFIIRENEENNSENNYKNIVIIVFNDNIEENGSVLNSLWKYFTAHFIANYGVNSIQPLI